jgi:Protein of unknown function (DUF669)
LTTIDFNALIAQAKTAGFDVLPAGDYDVQCAEASATKTSTGKDMIKGKYKVLGGPRAGTVVWNNYTVSPENATALAIWFRDMKAHGLDDAFFSQLTNVADPYPRIAAAMVGRSVRMTLTQREWPEGTGNLRNNVSKIIALAGGGLVGGVPMPGSGAVPPMPQPGVPSGLGAAPVPQPTATSAPPPAAPPVAPQPPAPPPQPAPVPQPVPVPQPQPAQQPTPASTVEQPPAQQAPPALPF